MERPADGIRYQCIFCLFVGKGENSLEKHLFTEHPRNNFFWCKWCGKFSDTLEDFFKHLGKDVCDETFEHPCGFPDCQFSDPEPNRFIAHLKGVHKGKSLFPCKYCNRQFTLHPCLISHLQRECCNRPNAARNVKPKPRIQSSHNGSLDEVGKSTSALTTANLAKSKEAKTQSTISSCGPGQETEASSSTQEKAKSKGKGRKQDSQEDLVLHKAKKKKNDNSARGLFSSGNHSDSDCDDPTWNPSAFKDDDENLKVKRRKTSSEAPAAACKKSSKKPSGSKNSEFKTNQVEKDNKCKIVIKAEIYKTWDEWFEKMKACVSPEATEKLLKPENISNFFKCINGSCGYSDNQKFEFMVHALQCYHNKKIYQCCYCFKQVVYIEDFMNHLLTEHSNRRWQCSGCIYRSCSKAQLKAHQKTAHAEDVPLNMINCERIATGSVTSGVDNTDVTADRNWYSCTVAGCQFTTLITNTFQNHLKESHPTIKTHCCSFCKYRNADVGDLIKHYYEHGIFNFECYYCSFGSNCSDDVILHMSINHADVKSRVLQRSMQEEENNESSSGDVTKDVGNSSHHVNPSPTSSSECEISNPSQVQSGNKASDSNGTTNINGVSRKRKETIGAFREVSRDTRQVVNDKDHSKETDADCVENGSCGELKDSDHGPSSCLNDINNWSTVVGKEMKAVKNLYTKVSVNNTSVSVRPGCNQHKPCDLSKVYFVSTDNSTVWFTSSELSKSIPRVILPSMI